MAKMPTTSIFLRTASIMPEMAKTSVVVTGDILCPYSVASLEGLVNDQALADGSGNMLPRNIA
ncbi:hypothetical protein BN873_230048 [Candidatus Competibacter denitrificans Run_A_D11]|uniref:Uncharacterized protein n=1 Tax=Candidatus Competibacter denitrificans Run_A_D11 TaxID=1400863 RepID=W6MCJ7_9GAMM|nr:hypothetical protein BN873_230048 [Candidatus Competibacter denitrificans Run_A_D11]